MQPANLFPADSNQLFSAENGDISVSNAFFDGLSCVLRSVCVTIMTLSLSRFLNRIDHLFGKKYQKVYYFFGKNSYLGGFWA